ncbi:retrovirus-related pol polyprotein from transposon TNT 1-94 [Tanacetum coccineum]
MTTLADKAILSGDDNRPPMLENEMYDSWKSRMELYMLNRQHGRMILESVENGPLIWPLIEENGVTRPKKYFELSATETIQSNCDIKATNIILQGLPPKVYALKGDDPIDAINHMMSFLTVVFTSCYPTNNNQLRNSSNHWQQATINNGKVTLQPIQGRQISLAMGTSRTYTPGTSGSNSVKQRTVICYNCKREGHMSKQCTKPKRKRDDSWFKDKVLLVQAQASGQILHEEELAFLADLGIPEVALMANLSHYGLDALAEVYNHDNVNNNMINQAVQSVEIDHLEQTLSEHLKEKESLMQTISLLKDDFKKEESRNIDREIALEKRIKHLDNIVFKRDQSAQTVHMLTKPQFFYDHTTKQALGFQNPFYLKKAQQLEPKLYVGNVIEKTNAIVIPDSKETLLLAKESHLKMFLKQKYPIMSEKKVNTTPFNYANPVNSPEPNLSSRPTIVEVLKELPKVSMVNTSLKKLKHHRAGFDVVVKERTTPTAITEGSLGFEHTKACFRDEIIPFVKAVKDLFNTFNQYLVDELSEVQNVFHQMEQAMEQHRLESKTFEVKMNQVLNETKCLLEQVIRKDIVNILVNSFVNIASVNVHECEKCLKLETELLNKKDLAYKQLYDSIKPTHIRSKEQCDDLINQVNLKSVEISDLNASLQEKVLEITALKDYLRKLKGKALADNAVTTHTIDPYMLKIDV